MHRNVPPCDTQYRTAFLCFFLFSRKERRTGCWLRRVGGLPRTNTQCGHSGHEQQQTERERRVQCEPTQRDHRHQRQPDPGCNKRVPRHPIGNDRAGAIVGVHEHGPEYVVQQVSIPNGPQCIDVPGQWGPVGWRWCRWSRRICSRKWGAAAWRRWKYWSSIRPWPR